MVKVQIVEEKDSSSPYASSSSSRTSSSASLSSVSSELSADESFFDRLVALVDIVPPTTRHTISSRISKTASFLKRGGKLAGNIVWVVTTSALLVGLPLALSLEDEAKIVTQEKEMLAQQQGAQQVSFVVMFANSGQLCLCPASVRCPSGSSLSCLDARTGFYIPIVTITIWL
jgi:import receptor subunit TOM22